jgi:hypothetical protein
LRATFSNNTYEVDSDSTRCADTPRATSKIAQEMKLKRPLTLLVRIIDENNSWNFKQIQEMDERR